MCCVCKQHYHILPNKKVMADRNQDAFSTVGCVVSNHCLDKLRAHDKSEGHKFCMEMHGRRVSKQQGIESNY